MACRKVTDYSQRVGADIVEGIGVAAEHERGDGYADGVPDAGSCYDGGGENAVELDVVALGRLIGRHDAATVSGHRTVAMGSREALRRRRRGALDSCLVLV